MGAPGNVPAGANRGCFTIANWSVVLRPPPIVSPRPPAAASVWFRRKRGNHMPSYSPFGAPERAVTAAAPPTGMSLAPHLRYSSTAERGQRPRHPSLRHRLHTLCTTPPDSRRRLTFALCRRVAGTGVPADLPGEPESAAANDAAPMGTLSNVSVGADDGAVEALLRLLTRPQFLVPPLCSFPSASPPQATAFVPLPRTQEGPRIFPTAHTRRQKALLGPPPYQACPWSRS